VVGGGEVAGAGVVVVVVWPMGAPCGCTGVICAVCLPLTKGCLSMGAQFSVTDQLNLGIRALELDLHWFNGKIRLCHSHGPKNKIVTDVLKVGPGRCPGRCPCPGGCQVDHMQQYVPPGALVVTCSLVFAVQVLEKLLHKTIDWDLVNIGCGPWDRPLEKTVKEVVLWMQQPANVNETLML